MLLEVAVAATDHYLKSLMKAALALPGIATASSALDEIPVTYKHLSYEEDGLMEVQADYFDLGIPINGNNDLTVSVEYEAMSGASPIFSLPGADGEIVQVTSGASITDQRTAVAVNYRYFTNSGIVSVSPAISTENDYDSNSVTTEYQWERNGKSTTYSIGAGISDDRVGATDQDLNEDKAGSSVFAGITQVLSSRSLLQVNISLAEETGYLSDPYKLVLVESNFLADNRPSERRQTAFLLRYITFKDSHDASLHLGYRLFQDDWGIESHTLESTWNQELSNQWLASYSFRYYTQEMADFYAPFFTTAPADGNYSSDYRLAAYGSVLVGLKLVKTFNNNSSINLNLEYYTRREDLKLGGDGSTDPEPLESYIISFGFSHAF